MLTKSFFLLAAVATLAVLVPRSAFATDISIDENCNGFFNATALGCGLMQDPGPGGLANVMTYTGLASGVTIGDVLITDLGVGLNDLIRFNGDGTILFYSDNVPTFDSPADTPGPPGVFYANQLLITECGGGAETACDTAYTPLPGQPGYDPSNPGATYHFFSEGTATVVPEPGTFILVGTGAVAILGWRRKKVVQPILT